MRIYKVNTEYRGSLNWSSFKVAAKDFKDALKQAKSRIDKANRSSEKEEITEIKLLETTE